MGAMRTALPLCLLAALPALADGTAPPSPAPSAGTTAPGGVPVEKFFKGKVQKVEGRAIELLYDFETASQLDDFDISIPFRAIRTVARVFENGRIRITGTGSLRHRAVFDKTVGASATLTPIRNRDFGFAVTEERESEVFTLFCLYDKYFSAGDKVFVPQNMIIKFIPREMKTSKDGVQDWRYCGSRGQKPEIVRATAYKVVIERDDEESRLVIDDWESKGKETGRPLSSQMVGLYAYDGDFRVDDLVVRGTLEPGYVERNRIDLTTWKPPAPPEASVPVDVGVAADVAARVRAKIAGYPLETKHAEMAALLADAKLPDALRTEAAEKAVSIGQKKIVPFLVEGLYAADEPSRRASYDVLVRLVGRQFPYKADAPDEARKKGILSINEYLKKHATEFE
jgi:hypothetical protein